MLKERNKLGKAIGIMETLISSLGNLKESSGYSPCKVHSAKTVITFGIDLLCAIEAGSGYTTDEVIDICINRAYAEYDSVCLEMTREPISTLTDYKHKPQGGPITTIVGVDSEAGKYVVTNKEIVEHLLKVYDKNLAMRSTKPKVKLVDRDFDGGEPALI